MPENALIRKRKRPPSSAVGLAHCVAFTSSITNWRRMPNCEGRVPVVRATSTSMSKNRHENEPPQYQRHHESKLSNSCFYFRNPEYVDQPSGLEPTAVPLLPGLFLLEDFHTGEEEAVILDTVDNRQRPDFVPWKHSFSASHHAQRWGIHCDLKARQVTASTYENPLPWFIPDMLAPKQKSRPAMTGWTPIEANAIFYRKQGHALCNHVDNRQLS
jgi:hypothetical protein